MKYKALLKLYHVEEWLTEQMENATPGSDDFYWYFAGLALVRAYLDEVPMKYKGNQ